MTMFSLLPFYDPRVHVSQMWHHYHMVLGLDIIFFGLLVGFKMESITEFSCCTSTVCVCHQTLVSTCDAVLWCKTLCILRNKIIKCVRFPPTILTVLLMSSWNCNFFHKLTFGLFLVICCVHQEKVARNFIDTRGNTLHVTLSQTKHDQMT